MVELKNLVSYLDSLLRTKEIKDVSLNGLQVDGPKTIKRIAFAVDVSSETILAAAQHKAQLLIVHHGLFWGKSHTVTGSLYERLHASLTEDIAIYASHLPLDLHPLLGNNAQLIRILGLKPAGDFAYYKGTLIGKKGVLEKPKALADFIKRVNKSLGVRSFVASYGPSKVGFVGVVSGEGSFSLEEANSLGIDTLVTGETNHVSIPVAKELGMNIIFGGHYATETLGVKALQAHVTKKFNIPSVFLDFPTGL